MATSEEEHSAINREEIEPEAIINVLSISFAWSIRESICLLFFRKALAPSSLIDLYENLRKILSRTDLAHG